MWPVYQKSVFLTPHLEQLLNLTARRDSSYITVVSHNSERNGIAIVIFDKAHFSLIERKSVSDSMAHAPFKGKFCNIYKFCNVSMLIYMLQLCL